MFKRSLCVLVLLGATAGGMGATQVHAQRALAPVKTVRQALAMCSNRSTVNHHYPIAVKGFFRHGRATSPSSVFGALFPNNNPPKDAGANGSYIHYGGLILLIPVAAFPNHTPIQGQKHLLVRGALYCAGVRSQVRVRAITVLG